jgi:uncharacterized protein
MGAGLRHFEIPARDLNTEVEFYAKVFDWTIGGGESRLPDYRVIDTRTDETVAGGIYKRKSEEQVMLNHYGVDDLDTAVEKITAAGGSVRESKTAVKGTGYFAVCTDPDGSAINGRLPVSRPG